MRRRIGINLLVGALICTALWMVFRQPQTQPTRVSVKCVQSSEPITERIMAQAGAKPNFASCEKFPRDVVRQRQGFTTFRAVMSLFDPVTAEEIGVSAMDRLALDRVLWEYRQQLNQLIADRGLMKKAPDGVVTLAFQLDSSTAHDLRNRFLVAARKELGDAHWLLIEHSNLMGQIDYHMDYWGEFPSAYCFERVPPIRSGLPPMIKFDYLSDHFSSMVRSSSFPQDVFSTLYAPIATKIGL